MFKAGRYVKPPPSAQAYCTRLCVLAWAAQGSQKDRLLRSWEGRGPVIACKCRDGWGSRAGVHKKKERERVGGTAVCDSFGLWIQRQRGSCINPSTYKDKPLTLLWPGTLQEWVAFHFSPGFSTALQPHNLVKIRQLNNDPAQSLDLVTHCSSHQPSGFFDHTRVEGWGGLICDNTFGTGIL